MARVLGRPLEPARRSGAWWPTCSPTSAGTGPRACGLPTCHPCRRWQPGSPWSGSSTSRPRWLRGKGVIIAAPHLGGWEWGAMYLAGAGMPVTVAVEPLEPPERFEWFVRFRERLGMQVVASRARCRRRPYSRRCGTTILSACCRTAWWGRPPASRSASSAPRPGCRPGR